MSIRKTEQFLESMGTEVMQNAFVLMQNNPAFQLIADAVQDLRMSGMISDPSGEKALQMNGFRAGVCGALELFLHADQYGYQDDAKAEASQVAYLMEIEGYSKAEAEKILADSMTKED